MSSKSCGCRLDVSVSPRGETFEKSASGQYAVDVLRDAQGANYAYDYRDCEGFMVPRQRLVYPLGTDNRRVSDPILVSMDIGRLKFRFG
jgi:hypothetical protein